MLKNDLRKAVLLLCFVCAAITLPAQYTVTGGSGKPLMAHEEKAEKLEVYLVYGTGNVSISFTSASTSHQWYRYKTKQLEAEKIPSVQNGTTSTIRDIEDGYGYFVQEPGLLPRFVWIIDYSKYALNLSGLRVSENSDACSSLLLAAEGTIPRLTYYLPSMGIPRELDRQYDVVYDTLDEADFTPKTEKVTLSGNLFEKSINAPLRDTEICVKGDYFARHFNKEISLCTEQYATVALNVRMDTLLVEQDAPNINTSKDGICAPATVLFTATANTPVATLFNWFIYRKGEEENPIVRFTGEEVEYTFNQAGEFIARLEVADRTSTCVSGQEIELKISESYLKIPNAFSPGTTPGVNDEFKVAYKSIVQFKGWIFNRWGAELFRWSDPSQGWDGKKGGTYVAPGVYFYVIEAEGSDGIKYKEKGDINILRPKTIQEENESIQK